MKRFTYIILVICFYNLPLHSQSYIGHTLDNYSGIHGIITNPSAVTDSRMRTDVNLFSVSTFAGSDYFSIEFSDLNNEDGFDFEDDVDQNPMNNNQFFLNFDVLGPSFMFNLSPKHSLGFTSRLRAFLNLNNINGELYESLSKDFDTAENFNFEMNDFTGTTHVWGEIGITYGRILLDQQSHFLKGGITLKYLQGGGTAFAGSPALEGQYDAMNEILTTSGTLNYGFSTDFNGEDFEFEATGSGFGGDIGFIYEFRNTPDLDSLTKKDNKYKFKLGLSLTDIGKVSYDDTDFTAYNLNNTASTSELENKTLEEFLDDNYEGNQRFLNSKISLPTALHFIADYNFTKRLYVSLNGSFSLVSNNKEQANRIINTVTATPRFETRIFSFYLPVSIRQYDGFAAGAGLRLGPLTIGSASLITSLLSDSSKTADLYVGLKVPIYQ
ncbi:DUF5723 family protein [Gramella lutea]|uniref:DUF5723 family protein n=1 Tax=Christiangramia lutea TaxID=1607951 RepID=A0A9X1V549_9FLAO|nr:DUF5723 family protein [Christiangramia lutea]MCH4823851.1 DUF5723 family protein [Christiangramia lutea]